MCVTDPTTRRRGTFLAEVIANERLCEHHYRLRLRVPAFPPTRPGQFVQLQCTALAPPPPPHAVDWPADGRPRLGQSDLVRREALLRRPFSIAGRGDLPDGAAELRVIYRVIGAGTGWLENAAAGSPISVLGPLGNVFPIHPDKPLAAVVGGGVGIPPMIYLAEALAQAGKSVTAFCGVRSAHLLPLTRRPGQPIDPDGQPSLWAEDFAAHNIPTALATDDGTLGYRGFVHDQLSRWLAGPNFAEAKAPPGGPEVPCGAGILPAPKDASKTCLPAASRQVPAPQASQNPADRLVVYSCGPEPMMRAVAGACAEHAVECHLALERHMACGMGTCQSCVFRMPTAPSSTPAISSGDNRARSSLAPTYMSSARLWPARVPFPSCPAWKSE
jgi:dihydroorotate dehydrogenase electron transfer subunit